MKKTFLFILLLPVPAGLLQAQTIPGLGNATFPTSTHSAAAQSDFMRGLLLLHLFGVSLTQPSHLLLPKRPTPDLRWLIGERR